MQIMGLAVLSIAGISLIIGLALLYMLAAAVVFWLFERQIIDNDMDDSLNLLVSAFWIVMVPLMLLWELLKRFLSLFPRMYVQLDRLYYLINRKIISTNSNGVLYQGRWPNKHDKYTELVVRDTTGRYSIPVDPRLDTVDSALAWSYEVNDYEKVTRA